MTDYRLLQFKIYKKKKRRLVVAKADIFSLNANSPILLIRLSADYSMDLTVSIIFVSTLPLVLNCHPEPLQHLVLVPIWFHS